MQYTNSSIDKVNVDVNETLHYGTPLLIINSRLLNVVENEYHFISSFATFLGCWIFQLTWKWGIIMAGFVKNYSVFNLVMNFFYE